MFLRSTALALTGFALLAVAGEAKAVIVIDDFTITQGAQDTTANGTAVSSTASSATFFEGAGGATQRTFSVNKTGGTANASALLRSNPLFPGATENTPGLFFDQFSNVGSLASISFNPMSPVDLTAGGNTALILQDFFLTGNGLDFIFSLTGVVGGMSTTVTSTFLDMQQDDFASGADFIVSFASFGTNGADVAANLTNLTLTIDGRTDSLDAGSQSGRGSDFETSGLIAGSLVPEPSSLVLAGLGIVGLLGRRLRRRQSV